MIKKLFQYSLMFGFATILCIAITEGPYRRGCGFELLYNSTRGFNTKVVLDRGVSLHIESDKIDIQIPEIHKKLKIWLSEVPLEVKQDVQKGNYAIKISSFKKMKESNSPVAQITNILTSFLSKNKDKPNIKHIEMISPFIKENYMSVNITSLKKVFLKSRNNFPIYERACYINRKEKLPIILH